MRLRIEATAAEMAAKGDQLLKAVAEELQDHRPDLAEAVRKAIGDDALASAALSPALRHLEEASTKAYEKMLERMLSDIGDVLDEALKGVAKSVDDNARLRIVERLVKHGVAREGLDQMKLPELLKKAAELP